MQLLMNPFSGRTRLGQRKRRGSTPNYSNLYGKSSSCYYKSQYHRYHHYYYQHCKTNSNYYNHPIYKLSNIIMRNLQRSNFIILQLARGNLWNRGGRVRGRSSAPVSTLPGLVNTPNHNTNNTENNIYTCRSSCSVQLQQPQWRPERAIQATAVKISWVDSSPCSQGVVEAGEVEAVRDTDLLLPMNKHRELHSLQRFL